MDEEKQYEPLGIGNKLLTKSFDRSLIQFVKLNKNSDKVWGISLPNREQLRDRIN